MVNEKEHMDDDFTLVDEPDFSLEETPEEKAEYELKRKNDEKSLRIRELIKQANRRIRLAEERVSRDNLLISALEKELV